jgi:hypothetical protein
LRCYFRLSSGWPNILHPRSRATSSSTVSSGLRARANIGNVVKVESITEHNKLVAYEAQIVIDGKATEEKICRDGNAEERKELAAALGPTEKFPMTIL